MLLTKLTTKSISFITYETLNVILYSPYFLLTVPKFSQFCAFYVKREC